MTRGLITTLADIPALKGKGPATSQITVARLGKYQDARYGSFSIAETDYEGWKQNLSSTFGGKVSVDFDHSSDRGRGTEAAGWITGLERQGKDVIATVEWTPKGAKAIRDKSYQFISPTYTNHYRDETGVDRGRALLGAACTNRPVLRQLPTLSLSREPLDGVATLRNRKKNGRPMSTKTKVKVLSKDGTLVTKKLTLKQMNKELARVLARPALDAPRTLAGTVDTVITLAQFAPAGVQHAGTVDWEPPDTGAGRQPPGLDDAGKALHAVIANHATSKGEHYFAAMAHVTGIPAYRDISDIPPTPVQQGMDPDRQAQDGAARALAASAGIGWFDALAYFDELGELARLQADTGAADVPWLDTRELASPPRPWSDEDWSRDKRRADAAGVDVDKAAWQSGAELGIDAVGQVAEQKRQDAIATHQARSEGFLDQARAREDDRRSSAINDELTRRAHNRVSANGRPGPATPRTG